MKRSKEVKLFPLLILSSLQGKIDKGKIALDTSLTLSSGVVRDKNNSHISLSLISSRRRAKTT
jgi:hypothetical protein